MERGVCAFIAGFSRDYETADENGEDIMMRLGYNITYQSYGFYAQYLTNEFRLRSNTVVKERYAISESDFSIKLEPQAPLPEIKYPTEEDSQVLDLGLISLGA